MGTSDKPGYGRTMSGPFIKMVAQMAVQGFAVVGRAMITAYQQALQNAKAGGGAAGSYIALL